MNGQKDHRSTATPVTRPPHSRTTIGGKSNLISSIKNGWGSPVPPAILKPGQARTSCEVVSFNHFQLHFCDPFSSRSGRLLQSSLCTQANRLPWSRCSLSWSLLWVVPEWLVSPGGEPQIFVQPNAIDHQPCLWFPSSTDQSQSGAWRWGLRILGPKAHPTDHGIFHRSPNKKSPAINNRRSLEPDQRTCPRVHPPGRGFSEPTDKANLQFEKGSRQQDVKAPINTLRLDSQDLDNFKSGFILPRPVQSKIQDNYIYIIWWNFTAYKQGIILPKWPNLYFLDGHFLRAAFLYLRLENELHVWCGARKIPKLLIEKNSTFLLMFLLKNKSWQGHKKGPYHGGLTPLY